MFKKLLVPTVVLSVGLVGCSSSDVDVASLHAEVAALKLEVEALKQQVGGTAAGSDSASSNESGQQGAASESYAIGQAIVFHGVTFTITEGERKKAISENLEAKDGKEFLLYNIAIHNTSNEDYKFSQSDYSVVLSTGEIEDNYIIIDMGNKYEDLGNGDLASGGKKTGWVAFEVPEGDQPLEIRYEKRSFSGNESFKVKL